MFIVISFLFSNRYVYAGGFNIKSIGNSETGGAQPGHWWYTGSNPTLRGESQPGSNITVTIDGNAVQVSADSSGNWVYTPSGLGDGDHNVSLKNGGSQINFTLTLGTGNVNWDAVEKGNNATLPASGTSLPTMIYIGLGSLLMISGYEFLKIRE